MKILLYTVWSVLLLAGCSSDPDMEKPDTEIPRIVLKRSNPGYGTDDICGSQETHVFPLVSEQILELDLEFIDDLELSQYKIDIHHNFDCHSHGRLAETTEPWFVARIEKLESNYQRITEKITVPANVTAGNYHLLIYGLDKVGNEAEPLVFSMKIRNKSDTESPVLTLSNPNVNGVTVQKGSSITFEGTITDNIDLTDGRIELFYYDPQQTLFTLSQQFFPTETAMEYSFSIPVTIETTSATGMHQYHIKVYDRYNNTSEKIVPITIE